MANSTGKQGYPDNESDSSPLGSLHSSEAVKKYVFPGDLTRPTSTSGGQEDNTPFINFKVARYSRAFRTEVPKTSTIATVHLPVPAQLQVGYSMNYNNTDLGPATAALSRDPNFGGSANALIRGRLDKAFGRAGDVDVGEIFNEGLASIARNAVAGIGSLINVNSVDAAQVAIGKAINPHTAALFQGVNFREHNFSYKLIAHNAQESDMIRKIITQFKYSMHPSFGAVLGKRVSSILNYPEQWFISFDKKHRDYLYEFLPCALVSMNVNYNGSNMPTFFQDTKAPVHIEINLGFREIEIMTKETIQKETSTQYNRPSE